ncbi:MAG: Hpt domain-containing protein [Eubacteriales bacterium]|nr:Hpt domain-containing protein [Eubacteriales bacterium]
MEIPYAPKLTLPEFYEEVGGDVMNVLERLEDIETVEMFVLGFPSDSSYSMLLKNLQENDFKSAFRAAHTLKGIGYTLGFQGLGDCAAKLCDKLREGLLPSATVLQQLETEYNRVLTAIKRLKNN